MSTIFMFRHGSLATNKNITTRGITHNIQRNNVLNDNEFTAFRTDADMLGYGIEKYTQSKWLQWFKAPAATFRLLRKCTFSYYIYLCCAALCHTLLKLRCFFAFCRRKSRVQMNFDFYKVQFWSKAQKIQKQIVWSGKSVVVHVLSPWFMLIFFIDGFYIWFSTIVCGLYSDLKWK